MDSVHPIFTDRPHTRHKHYTYTKEENRPGPLRINIFRSNREKSQCNMVGTTRELMQEI